LKELIFRQDAESAPARRASVTLVYVVTKNEIEGKKEGAEIHFSRTISASGVSTYRLDSKEVTYEAYENLLQSIGVLVKARNFLVFQGDVESVASKSPAELTKLLEQISGADQLRGDYDELARKKEEAEENTIFSMQKKKMYVTQRKEVKEQKDEADLYQQRQEELADLRTQHVLWQIWRVKMVMETHQSSAEELKNTLSETQHKEDELESELQAGKKELARVSKLLGAAEKELAARSKQLDGSTPVLTETRAKLASLRKRIEDLDKSEAKVQRDRAAQQESIEGLRADMASLEEAEEELMVELDSAEGSTLQLDKKKAEEYARLREDMSARMASTRVEELAVEQELKSKQLRVQRMEAQEDSARTEMEASDKLMAEYAERSAKLRQALSDGERERQELRQSRDEVAEAIRSHQKKEQELRAELEVVSMQLRDAGDDRRRGKQEERMSEAVEQMQRIFSGVHGKLVDLCRPIQRKYAQAVAVTAGKQMDAIVVDTKHVASECIRYLKDQRIGTCLFLPLDNLVQKPVPERLRTFGGRYRLCIDLVECDDKFKPAVAYALGSTLVCDTLEEAQELCFTKGERAKVVTLKGHVIGKTGAMTGGSSSRDGGGGDTNRWEEKELERLRKRKADLEETLARSRQSGPTRQQLVDIETRLKALQTRTQYSQADLKVSDEKLAQLQQQRALKEGAVRDLRRETDALRKEVASLERRAAEITQRTREVELEVFGEFSKSVGVANIREYEEDKLRRYQELVKKRTAVSEQRASLSAQLSYELKRDFAGAIQRLQQQAAEAREQGDELEAEERDLVEKEKQLRVAVRAASDKVVALTEERSEAAAAVKAVQTQRGAAVAERAALEKKLSGEEILIERQRGHLHEVLQRAQVDEVALPVVDLENNAEGGAGAGGGRGRGRKDSISSASAASEGEGEGDGDESSQAPDDEDLRWTGSQSRPSGASGSGSGARRSRSNAGAGAEDDSDASASSREATSRTSRATAASTHFSQADNPTVVRYLELTDSALKL
jgi:structural maintenance of chromosome 1